MSAVKSNTQRIAILGAESSGKSALAEALAQRYQTVWVPEYLREFVEMQQRVPRESEQVMIACTQLEREDAMALKANEWLFCDTTPLMTAIYSEYYFSSAGDELMALADQHHYDFTVVTAPDLPWVADGLQRESPAVRQAIHERVLEKLEEREIPHLLIEGSLTQRVEQVAFALTFLMT